jgi:GAF domain-containing protein
LPVGGHSLIGGATADGEPRIRQDVTQAPDWQPNPVLPDTRSEVALSLRVRGRIIGALTVQSTQPGEFTPELVQVLQTMGDQVGTAIDNVELLSQTAERARRQRLLNEIATEMHGTSDPERIVNIGLQALSEHLGGARVALRLGRPPKPKPEANGHALVQVNGEAK